jgi:hypothetical protein
MGTLFVLLTLVVLVGGVVAMGRRRKDYADAGLLEEEPWRASLEEDDEPLDEDEIRAAEDAFWEEEGWDEAEDRGF